ncbi:MAG: hypothetical protein AAGF84_06085 [Planctomycetota bacterium]
MADVGHHNAAAWLDHFELRGIDAGRQPAQATLAPKPAAGHAVRFATPARLERLGQHLSRLSGTPVRVALAANTPASGDAADQKTSQVGDAPMASAGAMGIDRRDALGLPIVRDAFEVFPDAILVDARKEEPPDEDGSSAKPSTSQPD